MATKTLDFPLVLGNFGQKRGPGALGCWVNSEMQPDATRTRREEGLWPLAQGVKHLIFPYFWASGELSRGLSRGPGALGWWVNSEMQPDATRTRREVGLWPLAQGVKHFIFPYFWAGREVRVG